MGAIIAHAHFAVAMHPLWQLAAHHAVPPLHQFRPNPPGVSVARSSIRACHALAIRIARRAPLINSSEALGSLMNRRSSRFRYASMCPRVVEAALFAVIFLLGILAGMDTMIQHNILRCDGKLEGERGRWKRPTL